MPGFRDSPFEDIQRIRQDPCDRCHEGFPILKELSLCQQYLNYQISPEI